MSSIISLASGYTGFNNWKRRLKADHNRMHMEKIKIIITINTIAFTECINTLPTGLGISDN